MYNTYVCMYVYIHKRKEIPPHRTSRDVSSLVPELEKKTILFTQHSTLRESVHPSHHIIFSGLLFFNYPSLSPQKRQMAPKTCLVISLRDGISPFLIKNSQKGKKKHINPSLCPPPPSSVLSRKEGQKILSGHICPSSLLTRKFMLLFFKTGLS